MQMRDDLGITTKLENGKAYLEFVLPEKIGRLLSALQIEIWEEAVSYTHLTLPTICSV